MTTIFKHATAALAALALTAGVTTATAAVNIDRIEPTHWYVGMHNPSLQLMVYGQGIRDAQVTTTAAGVAIDSIVRLDSPDYLLVYLNTGGAQPGDITLQFKQGRSTKRVNYTLKRRDKAGDQRQGFTCADVLYMLMPDRFADGNTANNQIDGMRAYTVNRSEPSLRHGGDIEGIRQHLDYFNQLGVTALWVSPVLENNSPDEGIYSTYHGYATTNFYRVDPRFGTNDEYRRLTDEAHQHGLKMVMDMIFNHCGSYHPWALNPPSRDWFNQPNYGLQTSYKLTPVLDPYASQVDLRETQQGWFVSTMPDLNQHNPHVMTYLIQNSIWWIEAIGIDGIRMDTYPYAYDDAMARWMQTLNDEYPNLNVVGETWVVEPAYTAAWQRDSKVARRNSYLPTVMDFSFREKLDSAKHEQTDDWWRGYNRIYNSLCYDYLYPNPSSVMAFIENHDTDRFLGDGCDVPLLKQALAMLLTIPRIPQLYYGTEVLMNGTKQVTDGNVRKDFPGGFPGDKHNCFTAQGRTDQQNDMFNWLSAVLHWRQGNDVIARGKTTQFIPYNGIYVIAREYKGRHALTILNGTDQQRQMRLDRYREVMQDAAIATDVATRDTYNLQQLSSITLPPRATLILSY